MEMKRVGENIIIKMNSPELAEKVMRVFNYASLLELMKDVTMSQEEIDKPADEINASAYVDRQKKEIA